MFLRGIRGSTLVPIVSSIITTVTEIRPPNAPVPFTLEIPQLATRIENDMASTHSDFDQRRRANVLVGKELLDGDNVFPLTQGSYVNAMRDKDQRRQPYSSERHQYGACSDTRDRPRQ